MTKGLMLIQMKTCFIVSDSHNDKQIVEKDFLRIELMFFKGSLQN